MSDEGDKDTLQVLKGPLRDLYASVASSASSPVADASRLSGQELDAMHVLWLEPRTVRPMVPRILEVMASEREPDFVLGAREDLARHAGATAGRQVP